MSEIIIAQQIIEFLVQDGWDVYREVRFARGDIRADIVAMRNDLRSDNLAPLRGD